MRGRLRTTGALVTSLLAGIATGAGCNGSTARILERIDAASPPTSNPRLDLFLLRSVSTCAVGNPCVSAQANQCFTIADANGTVSASFAADTVQFLQPSDPRVAASAGAVCFRLGLDDALVASAKTMAAALRTRVFQSTGGDMDLDVHAHDLTATVEAGFSRFYEGLFLEPSFVAPAGLRDVTRDTAFVYAVTGFRDLDSGLVPTTTPCPGTNRVRMGSIGASTYTWLAMSTACSQPNDWLSSWLYQLSFGLRDVTQQPDVYGGNYPACGRGGADPTRWFPSADDCTTDPDAPACGETTCPDFGAYYDHVLRSHWRTGQTFVGNACNDGRMDFDETGVDTGGLCDLIGH